MYGIEAKREELLSVIKTCREGLTDGTTPLTIPLSQARPRPPDCGHFHVHGELFFQLAGRTVFTFPTEEFVLSPGDLLLVPALVTHAEKAEAFRGEKFRNLVLYAGNGVFSVHLARADAERRPVIDYIERPSSPRVRAAVGYLQDAAVAAERAIATEGGLGAACGAEEATSSGAFLFSSCGKGQAAAEVLVRSLVCAALAEAELALEPAGDRAYAAPLPRLVAECRILVLASLTDAELSVARLAEWLGCAADYLSHLHKAATGEALASFITRSRLERADELLAETRLSVKEVSWACGFSSESYFIRKFKERYGETPSARRAAS